MSFTENRKGDIAILSVKGKLDATLAPLLEKKICELLDSGYNKLILELSSVDFISSAGLRMLISTKKQVKMHLGTVIFCGMRNDVLEIIKICGFDHFLEIANTEEEALKRF